MFENDNAWPSFDTTPEPESQPVVQPEPEPAAESEAKPKAGAKRGKPARRPAKGAGFQWSADRIRQARSAFDAVADPTAAHVVATVANVPEDDPDRIALAVLKGTVAGPASLLVRAHDEQDAVKRTILLVGVLEKDNTLIRQTARVALALDAGLEDRLKPQGGSPMELATVLAQSANGLNVDPIRRLGE
ncbi:hypothetical protein [Bifidobacterium sp. SO1]|uniref:hypothetical protein n=1 Tax=Bifidobacterium sp. SO1 TaxID=2809029 RepID=UPI001BDD9EE9|nr:hypothetical protein [Bifidobacterium sp. SO1]MBT1161851.1 hypothetical protein [Bifidobacterium sp. SO1]